MNHNQILQILKQEMAAATGCTEPVAIAYASAKKGGFGKETGSGTGKGKLQYFEKCHGSRDSRNGYGRAGNGGSIGNYRRRQ